MTADHADLPAPGLEIIYQTWKDRADEKGMVMTDIETLGLIVAQARLATLTRLKAAEDAARLKVVKSEALLRQFVRNDDLAGQPYVEGLIQFRADVRAYLKSLLPTDQGGAVVFNPDPIDGTPAMFKVSDQGGAS
jgi:hypothetical protein